MAFSVDQESALKALADQMILVARNSGGAITVDALAGMLVGQGANLMQSFVYDDTVRALRNKQQKVTAELETEIQAILQQKAEFEAKAGDRVGIPSMMSPP